MAVEQLKNTDLDERILSKHNQETKDFKELLLKQETKSDLIHFQKDILVNKLSTFKDKTRKEIVDANDPKWTIAVQTSLKLLGYYKTGKIDGLYGANTKEAVTNFQISNGFEGIMVDGCAGSATISKIIESLEKATTTPQESLIHDQSDSIKNVLGLDAKIDHTNGDTYKITLHGEEIYLNTAGKKISFKTDKVLDLSQDQVSDSDLFRVAALSLDVLSKNKDKLGSFEATGVAGGTDRISLVFAGVKREDVLTQETIYAQVPNLAYATKLDKRATFLDSCKKTD